MRIRTQQANWRLGGIDFWLTIAALAIAVLMIVAATEAQGQTLTILHPFSGGADGSAPYAGVTLDRAGNLYGTTSSGGTHNDGPFGSSRRKPRPNPAFQGLP